MAKIYSVILFFLLFIFGPFVAHAATLSISPATGSFDIGERVVVKVIVTSNNVPFNAISGTVSFPPSLFSIESVSKTNSVLDFWVTEPAISKNAGTVKFEGIALGGFTGATGTVITVNLRANTAGTGSAAFESGQILANDGQGTDITGNLNGATFYVKEATPKTVIPPAPVQAPTPKPKPTPIPVAPIPAPEITQPAPTLKAPEIMLGTKYGAQAVLGTSDYPGAQTLITFVAEDGVKVFILGVADTDGSFNILVPNSLKHGFYTVSAVMIKQDKTNSDVSNAIVVRVGSIISDITWEIWLFILLLILAILYLLIRIYYHFGKNGTSGKSNKRELHDVENVVHKSFDIIREDVAERRQASEIKKDISDAEKIIDKKIKDIES